MRAGVTRRWSCSCRLPPRNRSIFGTMRPGKRRPWETSARRSPSPSGTRSRPTRTSPSSRLSAAMAAKAAFSFRAEHIWLSRPINGDPHEMTRGLGQIEQEILALIEDEGEDRPYTAEELANAIYRPHAGDDGCCTRSQKVAVGGRCLDRLATLVVYGWGTT